MISATDLLSELRSSGLTVEADAGRLVIKPAGRLTDSQRAALKAQREAVLAELAQEAGDRVMREDMTRPFGRCPGVRWLLDLSGLVRTRDGSGDGLASRGDSSAETRLGGSSAGGLYPICG
jgi:hypothetical protein